MTLAPRPPSPPTIRFAPWIAAALLALFWLMGMSASRHWSQTSDELPHVTGGYAYDRFGDYRTHPENGNLPQRIHGLAPLALGAEFPMKPEEYWRKSIYWQLGWDFFYGMNNPTDRMLLGARALNALWGVGLGLFIFLVARRWYGDGGGLLALGFFTFCPNFLGHSALATSDLAGVVCLTLASWFFWHHLQQRTWKSGLFAGLWSGLALVAKFNGVLVAPIYAGLALADALRAGGATSRGRRFAANLALCAAQAAAAVFIIWASFSFRFSARAPALPPLEKFAWSWTEMLQGIGGKAPLIEFALRWKLLPEAWLYGLTNVLAGEAARPAFFAGHYSLHGWWTFFPTLFFAKTTIGLLLALLLVLVGAARHGNLKPADWRWLPVALPAAVVWVTALTSNLNIGHRHILAVYPALFIATGALATWRTRWVGAAVVLLLAHGAESVAIRPHYLAFFNRLGGGPTQAHRLVVDSSLDWGQALPTLREWIADNRRPGEKFYLSYFGSAWAPHYGVRPDIFLPAVGVASPPFQPYELEPGLYAISATSLSEVYSEFKGPWRDEWSAQLTDPATNPQRRAELRFARLCKYLQSRPPDAEAGYSILLYRLSAAELAASLAGPVKGW